MKLIYIILLICIMAFAVQADGTEQTLPFKQQIPSGLASQIPSQVPAYITTVQKYVSDAYPNKPKEQSEAPKPEVPKSEDPKPEVPKPDDPKPEVPKPEDPKPEVPKP